MTIPAYQKPGIWANHFETITNPLASMNCNAVANLGPLPIPSFVKGATPDAVSLARWTVQPAETRDAFKARILTDLAAAGTTGVVVTLYEKGGYFESRVFGA